MTQDTLINAIVNTLGVEESEIAPESDFRLDLNATPQELMEIKRILEEELSITLPIESEEAFPQTVTQLAEMVHDACL